MRKIVCFDLEGPLSPQDNAFEVMGLLDGGKEVFEKISKFDDIISLEGREGYEPGDTLSLIAPFLVAEGIDENNVLEISNKAKVVNGSKELVNRLKKDGWIVKIISTSYSYHAHTIGDRIGVPSEDIWCTQIDFNELQKLISKDLKNRIKEVSHEIVEIDEIDGLVEKLDSFFFKELPKTEYGNPLERVKVVGGAKKLEAVKEISKKYKVPLQDISVVGDSITDYKMLGEIKKHDGKSIVFNGNQYAIPNAKYAVGSENIRYIEPILNSNEPEKLVTQWEKNIEKIEKNTESAPKPIKDLLIELETSIPDIRLVREEETEEIVKKHIKYRKTVRGEAADLG
ncbi:HAD superfamily hydrolase [Methanonatronarchaeum thermophilum]|uniref:phosphoserine phosphatase n=1 Tax=Methanonatronarchaeum thermophilum TaxID=1927129 RepID=A0A1Y3GHZ4_9EURY|nr:HAD hydrolase family protein [Methanonatronarchaeum thermophilum]OUJ19006.1 HAD superfamily hydrolase [Methanonatronarchaeum thermophilum]